MIRFRENFKTVDFGLKNDDFVHFWQNEFSQKTGNNVTEGDGGGGLGGGGGFLHPRPPHPKMVP